MLGPMETRWPPRSPQEALLSSPSGRKRLRMYQNRTSPSPSPLKKSANTPNMRHLQPAMMMDQDDEDDEETLQLQLEALEARLKLKKLQQKKLKAASATTPNPEASSRVISRPSSGVEPRREHVQVNVSPQKRIVTEEARSPGRVLLGIDKGLKGRNISLKRPPNAQTKRDRGSVDEDPFGRSLDRDVPKGVLGMSGEDRVKPPTFSEKIAQIRQQDKEHKERSNRLRKQRSTGFGVQQHDLDEFKNAALTIEPSESRFKDTSKNDVKFSRDEVLRAVNQPQGGLLGRSETISGVRNSRRQESPPPSRSIAPKYPIDSSEKQRPKPRTPRTRSTTPSPSKPTQSDFTPTDDPLLEQFSSLQLSKRLIPHTFLTDTFADKHISLIPSLLATIKSPTYEIPAALENDFIVIGIIASKSSPLSHKDAHKSTASTASTSTSLTEATDSAMNVHGKYMVFTLTDLKWTLDLYLFTTAYTRFWKLTPGTLIAILNPSIMPPPPGKADTGRFSLVLSSSDDTILEIGTSRDLGWCKSIRKDGKTCSSWVDKRRTEFCEWHVDRVVESTRRGRMEVNGMSAPYAPGGKRGGRTGFWGGGGGSGKRKKDADAGKDDGLVKEGPQWDRASASRYFIAPSALGSGSGPGFGKSAANLLDAENGAGGGAQDRGGSRDERARKRLAERERERAIARQLGDRGNGIGSEYLKLRKSHGNDNSPDGVIGGDENGGLGSKPDVRNKLGAEELGLKGMARNVKLGSIRKRLLGREDVRGRKREGVGGRDDMGSQGRKRLKKNPRSVTRQRGAATEEEGKAAQGRDGDGDGDGDGRHSIDIDIDVDINDEDEDEDGLDIV